MNLPLIEPKGYCGGFTVGWIFSNKKRIGFVTMSANTKTNGNALANIVTMPNCSVSSKKSTNYTILKIHEHYINVERKKGTEGSLPSKSPSSKLSPTLAVYEDLKYSFSTWGI